VNILFLSISHKNKEYTVETDIEFNWQVNCCKFAFLILLLFNQRKKRKNKEKKNKKK